MEIPVVRPPEPVDQRAIRRHNLAAVLGLIRERGPLSRADLVAATGLNKVTVSSLVADLAERSLVRPAGRRVTGSSGRPARLLQLDGGHVAVAAAEVRTDRVSVSAANLTGEELFARTRMLRRRPPTPKEAVEQVAGLLRDTERALEGGRVQLGGVRLAIPGPLDTVAGVVRDASHLGWREVPVVEMLAAELGWKDRGIGIGIDRPVNLALYAEHRLGAWRGAHSMVLLYGDVGVGSAALVDGRVLRGFGGLAGEFGHLPLDPAGPVCDCGRCGCLEALVGLGALARASAGAGSLAEDLEEVVARAEGGDPTLRAELRRQGVWLARGAAAVVHLLSPEVLVLGGRFSRLAPLLWETFDAELRARLLPAHAGACTVAVSTLGTAATLRGGITLLADELLADPSRIPPHGPEPVEGRGHP